MQTFSGERTLSDVATDGHHSQLQQWFDSAIRRFRTHVLSQPETMDWCKRRQAGATTLAIRSRLSRAGP